jgi:ankyrin repeat protein
MLAAGLRRVDAVKTTLLCKRSDPTTRDKYGKSALDWAATKGFNDVVVELLKSTKMEDDKANEQALELAAKKGHLLVSITLCEKIKDSKRRELAVSTILFSAAAAASESTLVIERLIKMVINPNHQDKNDRTALMLAVLNSKWLLFNKLLDLKANPDL